MARCRTQLPSHGWHFRFSVFSLDFGLIQLKQRLGILFFSKAYEVPRREFALEREPGVTEEGAGRRERGEILQVQPAVGHYRTDSPHTWLRPQAVVVVTGGMRRKTRGPPPQRVWIGFGTQSLFCSPILESLSDKSRFKRRLITVLRVVRHTVIGCRAHGFAR